MSKKIVLSKQSILTFTCLVAKPFNRSEAKGDLVVIQTLLLFKCKLLFYHANQILVSITTRLPSASLQIKGLATKYTTVKWCIALPIVLLFRWKEKRHPFQLLHTVYRVQVAQWEQVSTEDLQISTSPLNLGPGLCFS